MRTVVLRVVALAVLLLLVLAAVLTIQTMRRLPDTLVYFVAVDPNSFHLEPVGRMSRSDAPEERARDAVRMLAQGPSEAERARGLSSVVPAATVVNDVRFDDGIVSVDLSREFEMGGGSAAMQGRLFQLFYTLTQPADVDGVVLLIEGEEVELFGGEGLIVESPWLRSEHETLPVW
ncbi:MAG TPA: GerMN domain-containing protein [Trueperaceae bacterium]